MLSIAAPAQRATLPNSPTRTATETVLILLVFLVPTLMALAVDERQYNGINVWIKPLHFQLSLSVHFMTLIALFPLLAPQARSGRILRWSMTAAATASVLEIIYIMLQAARGRGSHFNLDTPVEAVLYPLMGVGAVAIVVGSFCLGLEIWRKGRADAATGLRQGAILGLVLGSIATLVVAGVLSSGTGHWVGGIRSDVNGLPVLGWSTTGGDLRVPHFFATHAMQVLPLAGWLADRRFPAQASIIVRLATSLWLALVGLTFAQAMAGIPFWAL